MVTKMDGWTLIFPNTVITFITTKKRTMSTRKEASILVWI
ncbi:hypothetical protein SAMN05518847_102284 [Paenibacillus sp. OV219]|nr:hypothetical protein SAMN05518847_102284 [Paenibacillus sp. OV219]